MITKNQIGRKNEKEVRGRRSVPDVCVGPGPSPRLQMGAACRGRSYSRQEARPPEQTRRVSPRAARIGGPQPERQSCPEVRRVKMSEKRVREKYMLGLASGRMLALHVLVREPKHHVCLSCAGGCASERSSCTRVTRGGGGAAGLCQEGGEHWVGTVKGVSCRPAWRGLQAVHT